jgi:hypothetical protein
MSNTKKKKEPFKLPAEFEPYRKYLEHHGGGNTVEQLIDALDREGLAFSNIILYTMAYGADEKLTMLKMMMQDGLLPKKDLT